MRGDAWPPAGAVAQRIRQAHQAAGPISALLGPADNPWQSPVIDTPLLLAGQVATNGSSAWLDDPRAIHALGCARTFDPD